MYNTLPYIDFVTITIRHNAQLKKYNAQFHNLKNLDIWIKVVHIMLHELTSLV